MAATTGDAEKKPTVKEEAPKFHNFEKEHPTSSCTLFIGETKLYVSSEILSMHSHFFRSLFFRPMTDDEKKAQPSTSTTQSPEAGDSGNEEEDEKLVRTELKEVRMEGVKVAEVKELLNIIYPSDSPITEENVNYIIELADKYHFNVVMHEVQNYLTSKPGKDKAERKARLLLADKYYLNSLIVTIVDSVTKEEAAELALNDALSQRTRNKLIKKLNPAPQ